MKWDKDMGDDAIDSWVIKKGMPYASSFVRTKLYELTMQAGIKGFVLEDYDWE